MNISFIDSLGAARSYAAATMARQEAQRIGIDGLVVEYGGLSLSGSQIREEILRALEAHRYSPDFPNGGNVDEMLLRRQDMSKTDFLMFGFTKHHCYSMVRRAPELQGNIHLLADYAGYSGFEIPDCNIKIRGYGILDYLPGLGRLAHSARGTISPRDETGVTRAHYQMIGTIRMFVIKALERIVQERNIILRSPQNSGKEAGFDPIILDTAMLSLQSALNHQASQKDE